MSKALSTPPPFGNARVLVPDGRVSEHVPAVNPNVPPKRENTKQVPENPIHSASSHTTGRTASRASSTFMRPRVAPFHRERPGDRKPDPSGFHRHRGRQ